MSWSSVPCTCESVSAPCLGPLSRARVKVSLSHVLVFFSLIKIIPNSRPMDPTIIDLQAGLTAHSELQGTSLLMSTDSILIF